MTCFGYSAYATTERHKKKNAARIVSCDAMCRRRPGARQDTADLTVLMIRAATLYGSAEEFGLRSSRYPFQPFSTVLIGIRIDAPRSEIPKLNLSIACVSWRPVRRRWLSAPYTSMCSLITGSNARQTFSKTSFDPASRSALLEKLACIPDPFQSPRTGLQCQLIETPYFSPLRSAR